MLFSAIVFFLSRNKELQITKNYRREQNKTLHSLLNCVCKAHFEPAEVIHWRTLKDRESDFFQNVCHYYKMVNSIHSQLYIYFIWTFIVFSLNVQAIPFMQIGH